MEMSDGRVLSGTIVAIELGRMRLRVGDQELSLHTGHIRSCRMGAAPGAPPAAAPTPAPTPAPAPAPTPAAEVKPADPSSAEARPPTAVRRQTRPAPAAAAAHATKNAVEHRSTVRRRIAAFEQGYPWLVPMAPTQWASCTLLVFATLSLIVHLSTKVAAGEAQHFGRSMFVAFWYVTTAALQVVLVPSWAFATAVMLIVNPALALFWMRQLFGLPRGGAIVALTIQLGFLVCGYGVLELVSSLMRSIELPPV